MPWPFVPPDPDMPNPVQTWRSNPSAVWIELSGMVPHDEQPDTLFRVGGEPAGVWVPRALPGKHRFGGVLVSDHFEKGPNSVKAEWVGPHRNTKDITVIAEPDSEWPVKVAATYLDTHDKTRVITVAVDFDKPRDVQVVVMPYAYKMPAFADHAAYAAAGGSAPLTSSGKVEIKVEACAVDRYAVFVAEGFPGRFMALSPVAFIDL